ARSPAERKAVSLVASEFFIEDGSLLRHEKCDSVIANRLKFKERQSANARIRHSRGNATAPAKSMPTTTISTKKKDTPIPPKPLLPAWLPTQDWDDFLDMRRKKGKPVTLRAVELLIADLEQLRASGDDPAEVLQQSIKNSWQGLFKLKGI